LCSIFIGGISLAFVPLVAWLLPSSPATAKFLRHGDDRLIAIQRLRENNTGTKASGVKWEQVWETFRDPKTWMWALMYLCVAETRFIPLSRTDFCCLRCTAIPSGGIGAFGGLITKGFGFSGFDAVLMQIPTGVIGIITLLVGIWATNKWRRRFPIIW